MKWAVAEDVEVKVWDRFAGEWALIDDNAEAFVQRSFLGDLLRDKEQMPQQRFVGGRCGGQSQEVFWENQEVDGRLWVNVGNGCAELILIDKRGGNFAVGNFLKESLHETHSRATSQKFQLFLLVKVYCFFI